MYPWQQGLVIEFGLFWYDTIYFRDQNVHVHMLVFMYLLLACILELKLTMSLIVPHVWFVAALKTVVRCGS